MLGNLYLISYSLDSIVWQLTDEQKTIDNQRCFKAITQRQKVTLNGTVDETITAWYNPNIAIPYGPIGYGGLPGLIMELSINEYYTYRINKINLNPKQKINIKIPDNGTPVTQEEFIKVEQQVSSGIMERRR